jgi:HlyD family secretion protein
MRRVWILGIVAAVAVAGTGAYFADRPVAVRGVAPETDAALRVYGLGTVEARILSRVGFEVGAALATLSVDAGDRVARGQEIAVLSPVVQEARLARARAAVVANGAALAKAEAAAERARAVLAQQQANNRRQQELVRQNVTSSQRAEEAQRDENVARADLAVAEAEIAVVRSQRTDAEAAVRQEEALLSQYRLNAPYDATVVARHAEAGTVVKAGDPIFTLADMATVWVQAYFDEERAGQLAPGQPATIRLRSRPQGEFRGAVARIGLESDRVNEERRVWIACADCPAEMYLGEQADVRVLTGRRASAVMVPETAIAGFDGRVGRVWIVRDGRLARVELAFGARDDRGRAEVTGGLPDGATVVADPPGSLREGGKARIGDRR